MSAVRSTTAAFYNEMRNKNSLLIFLLIVAVTSVLTAACGSTANSATSNNSNSQPAIVDVTTAQATIVPIPTYIEATANLTSDAQTDVAPAVSGKIVEVNFDIGSYVSQGNVLIRLDARDAR